MNLKTDDEILHNREDSNKKKHNIKYRNIYVRNQKYISLRNMIKLTKKAQALSK